MLRKALMEGAIVTEKRKKKEYLSLIDVSRNYNWKLNGNFFLLTLCVEQNIVKLSSMKEQPEK